MGYFLPFFMNDAMTISSQLTAMNATIQAIISILSVVVCHIKPVFIE
jgi:hypothetical protein